MGLKHLYALQNGRQAMGMVIANLLLTRGPQGLEMNTLARVEPLSCVRAVYVINACTSCTKLYSLHCVRTTITIEILYFILLLVIKLLAWLLGKIARKMEKVYAGRIDAILIDLFAVIRVIASEKTTILTKCDDT